MVSEIFGAIFELALGMLLIWRTWSSLPRDKEGRRTFNPCGLDKYSLILLGWGLTALVNTIGYMSFIYMVPVQIQSWTV